MTAPTLATLQEVKLPVCPQCGLIGRQPGATFSSFCIGPAGASHRKSRMDLRVFREVEGESGDGR